MVRRGNGPLSFGWTAGVLVGIALVLVGLGWWAVRSPGPGAAAGPGRHLDAAFVGSATCARCHEDEYRAWEGSQHQRAMQPAAEGAVLGDFGNTKFRYGGVESTFFRRGTKYFVRTDGRDGALRDFEIAYTFGVYPLQQYLISFPDGRLQALSIAWDARPKAAGGQRWFHLHPNERIDHRDVLHWTQRSQNWNFMCADCHSTDVRKNYDATTDRFDTKWSEVSVGCEACHGPGSRHVAWAKHKRSDPSHGLTVALDERHGVFWKADPATDKPTRSAVKKSDREIQVCAPCHSRRTQLAEGYHAGDRFLDYYRPELLRAPLYYADGQPRDEVYVWGSFLQSRMYHAGVTCSDCHDPHTQKLRFQGNEVCAQCHLSTKYDTPSHHFHQAGAKCVDCHMSTRTYMVVDPRRDHGFRIPRPDLSVALGVPNACNGCHSDKTAQWAAAAVRKWYGRAPQSFQRYAHAFADAERDAPKAAPELAALAIDRSQPAIARATALEMLERFPSEAGLASIRQGLADADPLVRRASIAALRPLPASQRVPLVAPLLDDPLRTVRIEAAASLAGAPETAFRASQRASFTKAAAEFEQVQRLNADRPEARTTLGSFYAEQGRYAAAEKELRSAAAMRPPYVPAYANLADLYRAQGRDRDAEAVLDEGLSQAPDSAALHHALGLTLVRLKRMDEAVAELGRAAALAPDDARFAYVYAVALHSVGRIPAARTEVERALARHPGDRDLLTAGASFALAAGDRAAFDRYARRLAELGPPMSAASVSGADRRGTP